jgi:hypothetical protein
MIASAKLSLPVFTVTKKFVSGLLEGLTVTEDTTVRFKVGQVYKPAIGSSYLVTACAPKA